MTLTDPERQEINETIARFDGVVGWPVPDYTSSLDALRPVEVKLKAEGYRYIVRGFTAFDCYEAALRAHLPYESPLVVPADIRAVALAKVLQEMK